MGKGFAPAVVVGLSVGRVGKKIAVQLLAVLPGKPEIIAQSAFILAKPNLDRPEVREPVAKFARGLRAWLFKHPEATAPPKEAPKAETPPVAPPEPVTVVVPPPPVVVSAPPPPPLESTAPVGPSWPRYGGIAVGVLAVGAAGFGAYQGSGAMSDGQAVYANANATLTEWQAASSRAQFADYAYGAAAVLAVGAIVLFIVGSRKSSPPPPQATSGTAWSVR
jgi:hypothetical protein